MSIELTIGNGQRLQPNTIITGDALEALRTLPDGCVDCCVTSPPYYGLRDYGTALWVGGNPDCRHSERQEKGFENSKQATNRGNSKNLPRSVCPRCGATRVDKQIGLDKTPELYIERLLEVFMEVRRVLKPVGTLWVVIGDSYWGGKGYSGSSAGRYQYERRKAGKSITSGYSNGNGGKGIVRPTDRRHESIKPKDLIGIPWMLAFALRGAGWHLRSDIIWAKTNPMPESVKDRFTMAHEHILLLSKSARYYFDGDAVREPYAKPLNRWAGSELKAAGSSRWSEATGQGAYRDRNMRPNPAGRNRRDVWSVCTKPYPEAHFATYPPELIVNCIKAGCPESGIVLDPFMGAGTTAVVARKLGRSFVGVELNPEYVKIANQRLHNELGIFQ
jgi:site-specific DNA-methyltransferase (cytosine-N4-specific)